MSSIPVRQPFMNLVEPVLHQAAWAHYNNLLDIQCQFKILKNKSYKKQIKKSVVSIIIANLTC